MGIAAPAQNVFSSWVSLATTLEWVAFADPGGSYFLTFEFRDIRTGNVQSATASFEIDRP
jgi:hypothetical protein